MTHSTQDQDSSFLYVLVCSTGTVIALASVWISFAPVVGIA
jgi:hypothetical protein